MAKKTSIKVRLVPESKPNSPFYYYVKKPSSGEKAKVKLRVKANLGYNYAKRFSEIFGEKKIDKPSINNPLSKTLLNSKLI